jgi:drug/metabolite transporter (DMT)-like permease
MPAAPGVLPDGPRRWLAPYLGTEIAWGCSFFFIKYALVDLSPVGVALARCALGAATLLVVVAVSGVGLPRERALWGHLWVLALLINVFPGILFALAESRVTSVLAGIINALTPLTTLFFVGVVFRDEPVSSTQLRGLLVGLLGTVVVLGVWRGPGANPWWAVLSLLGAVTLYGVSFPYARHHVTPRGVAPASLAAGQLLLATLTLAPFAGVALNGHAFSWRALVGVAGLGVFGIGLAFMWNFRVISLAGASVASTVTYLSPVVAVAVGVVVAHEPLTWFEPVGGLVVLLGAAIGQGRLRRR